MSVLLRPEPNIESPLISLVPDEDPLHSAVLVKDAPVLTGEIKEDITGQYILRGTVLIPKGANIIIKDANILAERDAKIEIRGQVEISDSTFSSNQLHLTRKYWHGFVVSGDGKLSAEKITINDATAGITCSEKSQTIINNSTLQNNVVGAVSMPASLCEIKNSTISSGRVGIQVLGGNPKIENVKFFALQDNQRIF